MLLFFTCVILFYYKCKQERHFVTTVPHTALIACSYCLQWEGKPMTFLNSLFLLFLFLKWKMSHLLPEMRKTNTHTQACNIAYILQSYIRLAESQTTSLSLHKCTTMRMGQYLQPLCSALQYLIWGSAFISIISINVAVFVNEVRETEIEI